MNNPEPAKTDDNKRRKGFDRRGLAWIVLAGLILSVIVFYLSLSFDKPTERYTFVAQSLLNVLIFAAIAIQAWIYQGQWNVMEKQTDKIAESVGAMREQNSLLERSVKAAEESADAAKRTADDANLAMKLSHYGYLEMVDWKVMPEADYAVDVAGTAKWGKPRELHICCRIINAGNIPATVNTIETRWGPQTYDDLPNATVIPNSIGYPYLYTVDVSSLPAIEFTDNQRFGGAIRGKVRYSNFFERRIRHFDQLFWYDQRNGKCGIAPMEGSGNNDERDPDEKTPN